MNTSKLETLIGPRCKSKDFLDIPDVKKGERCAQCEIWEEIDKLITGVRIDELNRITWLSVSFYPGHIRVKPIADRIEELKAELKEMP